LLQVTCEYYMNHGACIPLRVHTVVVSVQHSEKISLEDLRADVMTKVIRAVIPEKYLDEKTTKNGVSEPAQEEKRLIFEAEYDANFKK